MRVGIDLGTTYVAVAYVDPITNRPKLIKNRYGNRLTPSILAFVNDKMLYGEEAAAYWEQGQVACVSFFKRHMGNQEYAFKIGETEYSATDFSALLLKNVIRDASEMVNEKIQEAVITVPAYFCHKERMATIEAAKQAGIHVLHIINEPTAAAYAYGRNAQEKAKTILVYDLGGGTFDAAIVKVDTEQIWILGSDGDHDLGGKEWDDVVARYLSDRFYEEHGIDIAKDPGETSHLLVVAERIKKRLSAANSATCTIAYQNRQTKVTITRKQFDEMTRSLLATTEHIVARLLASTGITAQALDGIVLVGGSTRMQMVKEYARKISNDHILGGVHVDEAVALGAAIRAEQTKEERANCLPDLCKTEKEKVRFEERIPGRKRIVDVTSHSLGMISVSADGSLYVNSMIILKNTTIPASNTKSYRMTTTYGNNELYVYLVQGESEDPCQCEIVGKYVFSRIQDTKEGEAIIHVTYSYDEEGIIHVSARQEGNALPLPLSIMPLEQDFSWLHEVPNVMTCEKKEPVHGTLFLAIDLSGSMSGHPLLQAKRAMESFIDKLNLSKLAIGIVGFADKVTVILKPTKDEDRIKRAIANIHVDGAKLGYGNASNPFATIEELSKRRGGNMYVVVLTDGVWMYKENAQKEARNLIKQGMNVYALGFGCADESFIEEIASDKEFGQMTELENLTKSFTRIAQIMT